MPWTRSCLSDNFDTVLKLKHISVTWEEVQSVTVAAAGGRFSHRLLHKSNQRTRNAANQYFTGRHYILEQTTASNLLHMDLCACLPDTYNVNFQCLVAAFVIKTKDWNSKNKLCANILQYISSTCQGFCVWSTLYSAICECLRPSCQTERLYCGAS